jgi:4-amino-4-deoxy-L-arabinose transferase-like glycosyltransferase
MDAKRPRPATHLIVVMIGLLALVRLVGMAIMPLMDTTEARYGEIGRKMAELGDWVTPWFDYGVPFWGKPPLSFWLTAASFDLLGVSDFAARLPHLLCGIWIGAIVWRLARPHPRGEALAAVAVMAGSALFFIACAAVMTDTALVLGTTLAMAGFWLGVHDASAAVRRRWGWLFFVGIAIGLLAKGPVALVLIFTPLLAWTALSPRRGEVWRELPWLRGALLVAALALPWYALAERHTPGFLQYFLVGEHWNRFVTPGWKGDLYGSAHRFPIGTIWVFAFGALLPWSVLVPLAAWRWRKDPPREPAASADRARQRYLWLWTLTPLLFFTPARNILWTYVLPAVPAVALLVAGWLTRRVPQGRANAWLGVGLVVTVLGAAGGLVVNTMSQRFEHKSTAMLVRAYEHQRAPGQQLAFLGHRPASAMFYSRGQALLFKDGGALSQQLGRQGGFVAVPVVDGVAAALPGAVATAAVGRFGDFELRYLMPAQAAGAAAGDGPPRAAP